MTFEDLDLQNARSETPAHDPLVITIDGPAGAGKSTVARELAEQLGFEFLDTGAMYRCVTLAVLRSGVSVADEAAVLALAEDLHIEVDGATVLMNGQDVSHEIRTPEVAAAIGTIADNVAVRKLLSQLQRDWAAGRRVVTEGRDQGSEVFKDSPCKIFLIAGNEERARRRQAELAARGIKLSLSTVLEQQNKRDQEDQSRSVGALRQADDAIVFCTDGMSLENVVEELRQLVEQRLGRQYAEARSLESGEST